VAVGTFTPASEDPFVQLAVARAETLVGSARSYLLDTVDAVWQAVLEDRDTATPWIRFRLANTNAFHAVKEAVGTLYEALGTTGVYRRSILDRHYRDIATMAQHVLSQTKTRIPAGRALLGLDPQSIIGF
jgi:alkylation response protein AidB-like acyl-CoA dehydrogenase